MVIIAIMVFLSIASLEVESVENETVSHKWYFGSYPEWSNKQQKL